MSRWSWASAACRGTSHERAGVRLQDAQVCFAPVGTRSDIFVAIVSDGAGSATYGGEGASIVCRSLSVALRNYFRAYSDSPADTDLLEWVDATRDQIFVAAQRRGLTPRDFAATLVCIVSDQKETLVAHIGDGCAVLKDRREKKWFAPLWPENGEYASTTSFITDEPSARLRIERYRGEIEAVALFSDGLERLALDFQAHQPFSGFLEAMCRPLTIAAQPGRNHFLSAELGRYLRSPRINDRTDDDKSLVIAVGL